MLNGLGSSDFNTFIHNVNRRRPGYVTEMYSWYVRPGVSFVGRTEHLHRDLQKALALMNLEVDEAVLRAVPRQNVSPSHIPRPEWDPALREETYRLEYASYVRFGYRVREAELAWVI
jgi:hypothetical protein